MTDEVGGDRGDRDPAASISASVSTSRSASRATLPHQAIMMEDVTCWCLGRNTTMDQPHGSSLNPELRDTIAG